MIEQIRELRSRVEKLYIYGSGFYGNNLYDIVKQHGIVIDGFLNTEAPRTLSSRGIPVYQAKDVIDEKCGIVLGMSETYAASVSEYLRDFSVPTNQIMDAGVYMFRNTGQEEQNRKAYLEVTTVLGCSVNCKYCPQRMLLEKYFREDRSRPNMMTVDVFSEILNHISKDTVIMFAGMGEPFLNPDCLKLLKMACDSGRSVQLFTSLVGASLETLREVIQLPIIFCTLHVADAENNAKIPLTEEYYKKLELLLEAKKVASSGGGFVDAANAQGSVDARVISICKGKIEVTTAVHDRAGNLDSVDCVSRQHALDKRDRIFCNRIGERLEGNVVLPDGTLLLCCQDYGMQHVLGNLYLQSMDEIRQGETFMEIQKAFRGDSGMELLCRKCLCAKIIGK
jgi:organic radical activating enzyme